MNLLIKDVRIVDPENKLDKKADILIENSRIKKIASGIKSKFKTLEAKGKIAAPGLIDMHSHLREPGREDEETLLSGSLAAIAGGFTTLVCMANTNPPLDTEQDMEFIYGEAEKLKLIDILPVAAVTKEMQQKELCEIAKLKKKGAIALSDDGQAIVDSSLLRHALEYAKMYNLPLISHCEELNLSRGGVMNEGYMSTILGLKGIPNAAESIMVARDIDLASLTGAHIHFAHISSKESVELIRRAKTKGIKVTAETAPHYFTLSDEDLKDYNTNLKINPPLRSRKDVEAIKEGLADGTIDVIATDHAPHLSCEKDLELDKAPFGMIGLETSLGVSFKLVENKVLTLSQLIEKLSLNPAKILKLNKGRFKEGELADITIIDPEKQWAVKKEDFESKSENSGFIGMKLKAKAVSVISSGRLLLNGGKREGGPKK
jgi:dihydroorotase